MSDGVRRGGAQLHHMSHTSAPAKGVTGGDGEPCVVADVAGLAHGELLELKQRVTCGGCVRGGGGLRESSNST